METANLFGVTAIKQDLEDALPNDGENLFGSTDPFFLPKEEALQEKCFSTDASEKPGLDCHSLKLEPSINVDGVIYDNNVKQNYVECGTSSMPGLTRICQKTETNLNCQRYIRINISVFAEDNVAKHKDIHNEEKSFKCDVCDRTYSRKSTLSDHRKTHAGKNPFECDVCKKHLTSNSNLNKHKKTHSGEKPFKCETCGKTFRVNSNLSAHRRTHTGEKPFECGLSSQESFIWNYRKTSRHASEACQMENKNII
ncbi:gastrula zinc finger protein XlCGF49.1-like isoform X3 [Artemia franciscana]|uniref:gastrula zinc finger protein XlCGF49.1-like isoform X3 n=1 Tax=Artemia franciscana TaxID=6661 RepID=UPI0032DA0A2E